MSNSLLVGVDYSLSSPAVTYSYKNKIHSLGFTSLKSSGEMHKREIRENHFITIDRLSPWETDQERYHNIAEKIFNFIPMVPDEIMFEGYAFAAKGRVFNIAEGCQTLKMLYYKGNGKTIISDVPPNTLKKFATGSGRAGKPDMLEAYIKNVGIDLYKELGRSKPAEDIIDSYFCLKYLESAKNE